MFKSFWQNETVLKVISFLLAFILWVYVGQSNNPDLDRTINRIPISVAHSELLEANGLCFTETSLQTVNIKVTGKRKNLANINSSNIIASVDLSGISSSGSYTLPISLIFPVDGIEVVEKNPSNFVLTVEKLETKTLPVFIDFTGTPGGDYVLGDCVKNTDEVTITGPKSIVDTVTKASATVNVEGISQEKTFKEKLKLYDSNNLEILSNQIDMSVSELSVVCSVDKTKTVKVIPKIAESFNTGENMILYYDSITPSEVKISGDEDKLNNVEYLTSDTIYPEFNDNEYETDVNIKIPDGIKLVDDIKSMHVHLSLVEAVEKKISVSEIRIDDKDNSKSYDVLTSGIDVTIKCAQAEFSELKQSDLGAYISVKNLSEGKHTVKLLFNNKYKIVGDYYVDVEIKK